MNSDQQKEYQRLVVKLEKFQEILKKAEVIEEWRKLQTKLLQQINSAGSEIYKNKVQLEEFLKEKKNNF